MVEVDAGPPAAMERMKGLVRDGMRDGAVGLSTSLQYAPAPYATTEELIALAAESAKLGGELAAELQHRKAIMGILDEGCMGMYNAIIDDELLNPAGIFKERLSQSALVAKMRAATVRHAAERNWGAKERLAQVIYELAEGYGEPAADGAVLM